MARRARRARSAEESNPMTDGDLQSIKINPSRVKNPKCVQWLQPVRTGHVTILLVLIMALSACGEPNVSDLQQFVNDTKARQKGTIPALPTASSYETYTYDETKLRDPFTRTAPRRRTVRPGTGIHPIPGRKRDILEQFPLDTLTMVGSLEQSGKRWALIKAGDGTLYRMKRGNYIGQDNGRILSVSENRLELQEIVSDGLGGWIKRKSSLSVSE